MKTRTVFAADLGASGGKCFVGVFKESGFKMHEIHRFEHEPVDFFVQESRGKLSVRTYWDDILLYNNIIKGLKKYRREFSPELDAIGIDTWGTDGHFITPTGEFLGKIYCYRDHRLDNMCEELARILPRERIYEITGIHFWPFNISNQLLWFSKYRKYLLEIADVFLPMPTVFLYYLGGVKKIDTSWASVTQVMDARKKAWSREILSAIGIPETMMPEIVHPVTICGEIYEEIASQCKINRAKLICVASHDTASAYVAAPTEKNSNNLIISSGTWSLVGRLIDEPITTEKALNANLSNEGGVGNIRLLKNCMGTWPIQQLLKLWEEEDGQKMSWDEVVKLVEKAPPFNGFIDPDNQIFYNPDNMEKAIIGYLKRTGQRVKLERGTLLRVIYESLAMKYRYVKEQIDDVCGTPSEMLNIVGGGSKNALLNQFAADATGLRVITGPEEATAVGNIMLQGIALGIINSIDEAHELIRSAFSIKEYLPKNFKKWDSEYSKFLKILKMEIN